MDTQKKKYLYEHTSQESAYVVEDYPWGFRLRTTIRYWIETKQAKNGGQRFGSQTINPKTGRWCAPKYSTYSPIMIMFLNEDDHIKYICCSHNDEEESVNKFKETHLAYLTDFQKEQLKEIVAYTEVMKHVTWTVKPSSVGPVSLFSNDPIEVSKRAQLRKECEEREKSEQENLRKINQAIGNEIRKITL
jgi:hypothetical protein